MRRVLPVSAAVLVLAAGCGSGGKPSTTSAPATTTAVRPPATTAPATTTTEQAQPIALELYFLPPAGKLVAASREIPHTTMPGPAALHELMTPPDGATTRCRTGSG